ncbi:O-antigen ligase family protein [Anaerovibrio sp. RM50]|uniref:O-antigen ligase family protein n=1 Tax=Anaerovibrio sp. RM50 TaxID=1200557 RepID=UPI000482E3C7|nr:O-antigen ligase family protein [Anaerovibrio sp. RM50]
MKVHKNQTNLDYFIFKWLWLIILLPKPVQLVVFVTVIYLLVSKNGFKVIFDYAAVAMCMLAMVHSFAILYNIAEFKPEFIRCIGAINTMVLWPIAALYVAYYRGADINIFTIGKYCARNLYIMLIPAIIAAIMFYVFQMNSFSLFGRTLFVTTYLSEEPTIKFFGLNDFSNINLFYIMLNLMLSLPYLYQKNRSSIIGILTITSFEVFLIHSRLGMCIFSVSLLFAFLDTIMRKYKNILLLMIALFGIMIVIVAYKEFNELFTSSIVYGNEDSTLYRIDLLTTSVIKAWDVSPLWGMGIKEVFRPMEDFIAYLGSHSTYVGFFYKTGFLGAVLGLFIYIRMNYMVIKESFKNQNVRMMLLFLISFIILFAIEDVDGTNWSMFIYFTVLSILSNGAMVKERRY